jgi:hypothetical protein
MPRKSTPARRAPRQTRPPTPALNKYHLVVTPPLSERDLPAATVSILPCGALVLANADGQATVTYAPGAWLMVELSRKDDDGETDTIDTIEH